MQTNIIVLATPFAPWPNATGATQRIHSLGQWLQKHTRVVMLLPKLQTVPDKRLPDYDEVIGYTLSRPIITRIQRKLDFYYSHLFNRPPKWDDVIYRFYNASESLRYKRILKKLRPRAVICEYLWQLPNLYSVCQALDIPLILDTIDIISLRQLKEVELGLIENTTITLEEELAIWQLATTLIAIQPEEAANIAQISPKSHVICLPQAFPPIKFSPVARKNKFVLIVASPARPNVQGISAFLKEQWPLVLKQHPDAELHICGKISEVLPDVLLKSPKTTFYGYTENLSSFYHQAHVVLNPVLYGSGLKIKSVEALRYGKCLLSTPIGVEGMPTAQQMLPIFPPNQLGKALIDLLDNPENVDKYEVLSREIFDKDYTPDACYNKLLEILPLETFQPET